MISTTVLILALIAGCFNMSRVKNNLITKDKIEIASNEPSVLSPSVSRTPKSYEWRKTGISPVPCLNWVFEYPNGWHIAAYETTNEANYPVIVGLNPEPIALNLISIETRYAIILRGYSQFVNPEEELNRMLLETKNSMENIREESFSAGKNIVYRLQGKSKSNTPKTSVFVYYILVSEKMNAGKTEKSVIKAEVPKWILDSDLGKEYLVVSDHLVKSFKYEESRGGAGYCNE